MGEKKPKINSAGVNWEPPAGRRWSKEDARAGLAAARSSGEPMSRFARRHGIEVSRLYWWMKELREKPVKQSPFLPVEVVEKRAPLEHRESDSQDGGVARVTIDIVVGSQRVVRVERGFDPALLRAVIVALETEPC
jgi:transposase-like protein